MKNKVLTALLSVGIALVLWLYVVTVVSPNSDAKYPNVPVTVRGEVVLQERNLMITTEQIPSVSLHLEGNRTDLNKINSSNITIGVDVSGIGQAGTYNLSLTQPSFPADVPDSAITVLSKDPGSVTITVENRKTNSVPVEIQYVGTLPENYMVDKENRVLDVEQVTVVGPQSVVDQIAMARIEVNLQDRVESFSEQYFYTLCNEKGEPVDAEKIVTDVEMVNLSLKVVRVKEVALRVNLIEGGGATAVTSIVKIDPDVILVSGSDSLLENLEYLELGTVDLSEMAEATKLTFPIKLPDGITNETGVTEATVDIQFPQLTTKTVVITDIQAINVPAGMEAQLATKQLEVLLRGPKTAIDAVLPEHVTARVDFANEQPGTVSVKAQITTGNNAVGAVGTYNVTATLKAD